MNQRKLRISIAIISLGLALIGCRLLPGSTTGLKDAPAPTAIPLTDTTSPSTVSGEIPPQEPIAIPPGFRVNVFAQGLDGPRMLTVGPDGDLYVAERGSGRILHLLDRNGDGQVDELEVTTEGLEDPSSLAFYRDGSLYVGLTTRVLRLSEPDSTGKFQKQEVIIDDTLSGGIPAGLRFSQTLMERRTPSRKIY